MSRPLSDPAVSDAPPIEREPTERSLIALGLPNWLTWLIPVAAWCGLALYYFSSFVTHPSHGVVGGPDGVLFGWFFESVEHSLAHGQNPFLSPAMNAPVGVNLMWNTSIMLPAIILAPVTAAAGGLAVAGWLMVAAPVISATTAYLVLRRLTGVTLGSALAATLYGFGPFFVGQAGHLHLTLAAPVLPLLLLLGHRLLVRQTGSPFRTGIWLGLVVAVGMLISEEIVAIGLVLAVAAAIAGLIVERGPTRERLRFLSIGVGTGALVALVLLAVPLYYQFLGPLSLRSGVAQGNQPLDIVGLVRPSSLQYFARTSDIAANDRFPANGVENTGYIGIPLIVLVIVIVVWLIRRKDRFAYWWLLTAAAAVILSFGTRLWVNGHLTKIPLPWYAIKQLPLLHSTVTVRISVVTTLLIALLLAYSFAQLSNRRAYLIGLLVVAVCFLPLLPTRSARSPYVEISRIDTPRFFTTDAVQAIAPGSTALLLPQADGPSAQSPMYWQIRAKMRFNMIGGYAVFNDHGKSSYVSPLPPVATTLMAVATTGIEPAAGDVAAAKASLPPSKIQNIVITNQVQHPDLVAAAAANITGCTPKRVSDVILCQLPQQ